MRHLLVLALLLFGGIAVAQQPPKACQDEVHQQFDFWVGDWQVRTADGKVVGKNSITRHRCYMLESWAGSSGSRGMSLNFVDPENGKWTQDWVDNSGGRIEIAGSWKDGSMQLEGTHTLPNGDVRPFRGTWTPLEDGRVRQYFEESTDKGKSFKPWFEGFYEKVAD